MRIENKIVFLIYLILFFFLEIVTAPAVKAKIKIMPLGDSITEGISSGVSDPDYMVSYRKVLWDMLVADGYEIDFVGSLNNGSAVFGDSDLADHEGHPGWRDDEIVNGRTGYGKLEDWLITEQPKIILLHIGTNDLDPSPDDVRDILDIIDNYENNFGVVVWVILARIINRNSYSQTTTDFNDNVEAMALDRIQNPNNLAYPDKIVIVDMEDGANINYDLVSDNPPGDMWNDLHPYATGYEKMASVWYFGLQEILPVASAGSDQNVYERDPVTLDASNSFDPDDTIVSYLWEQQPGGSPVILSDSTAEQPTFTAPDVGADGETLIFKVTVIDSDGLESTSTTNVNVLNDDCPDDPNKTEPGICGCGIADIDTDLDGTPDCIDSCPNDPGKIVPGICGCGIADIDTDLDGTPDCNDSCPNDPGKIVPGICGCGISDNDSDGDGTPDCNDNCPNDPGKIVPGICGCGITDVDSDGDGTLDCNDNCPNDPNKIQPGICGCGVTDSDTDLDGTPNCIDSCPNDPNKTSPGICGCGIPETDSDGDRMVDCWEEKYGLNPSVDDADGDLDRDGFTNIVEYIWHTDPTDSNSYPSTSMPWIPLLLLDDN